MEDLSIYIHWPWCKVKCPYCDFNSHLNKENMNYEEMFNSYKKDIKKFYKLIGNRNVVSVFLGGGTPSLMPPELCKKILDYIKKFWDFSEEIEITLETNPRDVNYSLMREFKDVGINRVSLGVQSFNEKELKFLGRDHSANDSIKSIEIINNIFDNVSFDLISTLPDTSVVTWKQNLNFAIKLVKNHISIYQLTIEKGTKFFSMYNNNKFKLPNEDLSLKIFELTNDLLYKSNLHAYEVSNYSHKGTECIHNKAIWNYKDYIGIGPGAHSRVRVKSNFYALNIDYNPRIWVTNNKTLNESFANKVLLTKNETLEEIILMGLRLNKGINLIDAEERSNIKVLDNLNTNILEQALKEKLLTITKNHLSVTKSGLNVLDTLTSSLLN